MSHVQATTFGAPNEAIKTKRQELEGFQIQLISSLCSLIVPKNNLPDLIKRLKSSSKRDIIKGVEKVLNALKMITANQTAPAARMKLQNLKKVHFDYSTCYYELYRLYHDAIINQGAQVRKLGPIKAAEAVERLESLKADYKADTGSEWSEVKEEGPIILTRNSVYGNEIGPELKETLKQLRRDNAIRYFSFDLI